MLNLKPQKKPKTFKYEIKKLSDSEVQWFGRKYLIRVTNYGWFPTDKLMGVVNGRYSDTNNIGAKNTGNMGSATIGVENINKAKQLLGL